jgi:hypothetical protein
VTADAPRLSRILLRWTSRSLAEVAKAADVDSGNLSRFVRGLPKGGLSEARAARVLGELGWSSTGPAAGRVHLWRLQGPRDDVRHVFRDLLGAQAEVSPIFLGSKSEVLEHEGVLLGNCRGTWIVIQEHAQPQGDLETTSALDDLLDPRKGLAVRGAPRLVASRAAYEQIVSGQASPKFLEAALAGHHHEPASLELDASIEKMLKTAIEALTPQEICAILHDGMVRAARAAPAEQVEHMVDWALDLQRTAADEPVRPMLRRLVQSEVSRRVRRRARQAYKLDWTVADRPANDEADTDASDDF